MTEFTIKEGDTRPVFEHTLERNGSAIDLRDATGVDFLLRSEYGGEPFINSPATLEDAANGKVSYRFESSDMVPEGTHHAEFVIDWSDGGLQTVPNRGYIEIEVTEPIDRDIDPSEWDAPDATVTTLYADQVLPNSGDSVEFSAFTATSGSVSDAPTNSTDIARLTDLPDTSNFASVGHDHDGTYSLLSHDHDGAYSPLGHNHDATYSSLGHDHSGESLNPGELRGTYSDKVRGITAGGAISIDPANSTTPVQDTIDAVKANGGGSVILPPTTISEDTDVVVPSYVSLLGHGIEVTTIEVQNPTQSLLTINDSSDITPGSLSIDGIGLDGLNASLSKGAIYHPSESSNVNIGQLKVRSFIGKAWFQENAAFQLTCDQFLANNFDAGAETEGAMHFAGGGRAQKYDMLSIYPQDFNSGQDSSILTFDSEAGPDITVDYINVGGTAGRILDQGPYPFTLRGCNYEPVGKNSVPHSLFKLTGQSPAHIQGVRMTQNPSFDYVYSLEGGSSIRKKIMGPARVHNVSPINVVSIDNDLFGGACQFQGSTSDVDNNFGTLSVPLYCLDGEVT